MKLTRRSFMQSILAAFAAPAVVSASSLMVLRGTPIYIEGVGGIPTNLFGYCDWVPLTDGFGILVPPRIKNQCEEGYVELMRDYGDDLFPEASDFQKMSKVRMSRRGLRKREGDGLMEFYQITDGQVWTSA